ncbi:hypothetical protein C922_05112 [Plasmodium inui San Antonio 1]|uniref:Uncharacterized protein n=1 Tax=Plasmodium inui San Antonio 1 TaxID=1237626 RepID=W6ZZ25_9APIC|nr:hypothetical protein C922_05112 [Plasmodium inui San Antonio 1]EUD64505.1 hypothetical protein C922_05112 [Plasmodium inui San Antonio 1]
MKILQKCRIIHVAKQLLTPRRVEIRAHGTATGDECTNAGGITVEKCSGSSTPPKDAGHAPNANASGQSELVRRIRKSCRKDDLCSIYKFCDQFVHLLKLKKINKDDFSIVIHLLSKKKIHDNSFWRRIASTDNVNFIFDMNLKQIILTLYSIANSYRYTSLTFLKEFTQKLIFVLKCQKKLLSLSRGRKTVQERASDPFTRDSYQSYDESRQTSFQPVTNLIYHKGGTKIQANDYTKEFTSLSKQKENPTWNTLICKNDDQSIGPIFSNEKNHLNGLDLTLVCNTYSKLNNIENWQNVEELKQIMYKLFLYFLFFNKINCDHLILFMYSYTRVGGSIHTNVLRKVQKVLLNPTNGLHHHFHQLRVVHTLDVGSLNMLMNVLHRSNVKDETICKEIMLSLVINLNVKNEKRTKIKGSVLSGENINCSDPLDHFEDALGHASGYVLSNSSNDPDKGTHHLVKECKPLHVDHSWMLKRRQKLLEHFTNKDYTHVADKNHPPIKLKKKDLCFLVCNINKLKIKNYYNVYDYIKHELSASLPVMNVYSCCIMLDCLINLNILDQKLFKKILTTLKILFDKNRYNEKDVTDIFAALCRYDQKNWAHHIEILNFLQSLYLKVQMKLQKYNYINLISIFCSASYFNVIFTNNVLQDLCIDVLNNFQSMHMKFLLLFLYFLKSKNYEINIFFFNTIMDKVLSKIKDAHTFFYSFYILSTFAFKTLQKEIPILNKLAHLLQRNENMLNVEEKLAIALHTVVTPVLMLNETFFLFCERAFVYILCAGPQEGHTELNKNNQLDTTPKVILPKWNNSFAPYFMSSDNPNNFFFNTNLGSTELEVFLFLLLSDMFEKKRFLFKKEDGLTARDDKNNYTKLQRSQINTRKLDVRFNFIYIKLQNDGLSYFIKNSIHSFDRQIFAKRLDTQRVHKYTTTFNSNKYSNETEKNNERIIPILNEMREHFPNLEETLFNVIKMCYEDFFIYRFFAKKNDQHLVNSWSRNVRCSYADSFFLHRNDNLIIRLKKNMFINSLHIPYVLKPFQ